MVDPEDVEDRTEDTIDLRYGGGWEAALAAEDTGDVDES
jgi:hypothetical protein